MQILISTDHNIEGRETRAAEITDVLTAALARFSDHITRLGVHLADENGPKSGQDDIRCTLEARIEGRQPIAATHHVDTISLAVNGAADSLVSLIENTLGRTEAIRRREQA
ncbi:MAG: ribosomal subunit interface protein [Gemmatimonadota bacterium]|nr:ribosomal subunit interface protein [Gemmatimonadota bacterium]